MAENPDAFSFLTNITKIPHKMEAAATRNGAAFLIVLLFFINLPLNESKRILSHHFLLMCNLAFDLIELLLNLLRGCLGAKADNHQHNHSNQKCRQ